MSAVIFVINGKDYNQSPIFGIEKWRINSFGTKEKIQYQGWSIAGASSNINVISTLISFHEYCCLSRQNSCKITWSPQWKSRSFFRISKVFFPSRTWRKYSGSIFRLCVLNLEVIFFRVDKILRDKQNCLLRTERDEWFDIFHFVELLQPLFLFRWHIGRNTVFAFHFNDKKNMTTFSATISRNEAEVIRDSPCDSHCSISRVSLVSSNPLCFSVNFDFVLCRCFIRNMTIQQVVSAKPWSEKCRFDIFERWFFLHKNNIMNRKHDAVSIQSRIWSGLWQGDGRGISTDENWLFSCWKLQCSIWSILPFARQDLWSSDCRAFQIATVYATDRISDCFRCHRLLQDWTSIQLQRSEQNQGHLQKYHTHCEHSHHEWMSYLATRLDARVFWQDMIQPNNAVFSLRLQQVVE